MAAAGIAAMMGAAPPAGAADSHEGVVRQIRVDAGATAPLCVATHPPLPRGAWACFYPNRLHYEEMRELVFRALDAQHACRFEWTQRDALANRVQVEVLTCSPR